MAFYGWLIIGADQTPMSPALTIYFHYTLGQLAKTLADRLN
jgi:hypothetical protein